MKNLDIKFNGLKVNSVLEQLESNGFEGFLVGGCVRDTLMSKTPKDYDVATNATPEQVIEIFDNVIPTGIKHGTVTVMLDGEGYEVTTYRAEGQYTDNRHPDEVKFVSTIEEDLSRRDFTMNAMAWNKHRGLVDPYDGLSDIKEKEIRCVGDANERFEEDPLRMLRALRFSAQLGFSTHYEANYAMEDLAGLLSSISVERVKVELDKILLLSPKHIEHNGMILYNILPELFDLRRVWQENPYHIHNVFRHTMKATEYVESDLTLRWATLMHDLGKAVSKTTDENGIDHFYGHEVQSVELAEKVMRRLRFDNKTIKEVSTLIKYHSMKVAPTERAVKRFLIKIGDYELFKKWASLRWADVLAQNPIYARERLEKLMKITTIAENIVNSNAPLSKKDLAINGHDLMALGYRGVEIGEALEILLEEVLEDESNNTKEKLLSMANELKERII